RGTICILQRPRVQVSGPSPPCSVCEQGSGHPLSTDSYAIVRLALLFDSQKVRKVIHLWKLKTETRRAALVGEMGRRGFLKTGSRCLRRHSPYLQIFPSDHLSTSKALVPLIA